jgi:hypothetical protein
LNPQFLSPFSLQLYVPANPDPFSPVFFLSLSPAPAPSRLTENQKAMNKEELQSMIRFGAEYVFTATGNDNELKVRETVLHH